MGATEFSSEQCSYVTSFANGLCRIWQKNFCFIWAGLKKSNSTKVHSARRFRAADVLR